MLLLLLLGIDSLEQKLNDSERRAGAYMKRYNRIQVSVKMPMVNSTDCLYEELNTRSA